MDEIFEVIDAIGRDPWILARQKSAKRQQDPPPATDPKVATITPAVGSNKINPMAGTDDSVLAVIGTE